MTHTARDTFTKISGDIDAINTKIDACKQKLESNIRQHDSSDAVVTMNPISQENAISRDFFYWVSNLPDGMGDKLSCETDDLAKLYRKYVLSTKAH